MDKSLFTKDDNGFITSVDLSKVKLIGETGVTTSNGGVKVDEIFIVGNVWANRIVLKDVVSVVALRTGWAAIFGRTWDILCNCWKEPNSTKRKYKEGNLCKGCKWRLKMTPLVYENQKVADGSNKSVAHVNDTVPVKISAISKFEHTGLCTPCAQQQSLSRARSGQYTKSLSDISIFTMCTMYKRDGKLPSSVVKSLLKAQFPKYRNVSKRHVYYTKMKIRKMIPLLDKVESFQDFEALSNTSKLEFGLDNEPISDDNIAEMAQDLWKDIMNSGREEDDDEVMLTFSEFMEDLKKTERGFKYVILSDSSGRCTGCIWQTATMRENFERFGSFASLDCMKRGINKFLWPYVALSMYNEMEKLCLGCEGIICAERVEAYKAMIDFLLASSPKRKQDEINVLAADGFVTQDIVEVKFNLKNTHLMFDEFHLHDSILPKKFGILYHVIQGDLRAMCKANSEANFMSAYDEAKVKLQGLATGRNLAAEEALEEFKDDRDHYASYILDTKKGTRGKHGSSISESNHSSVLVHLNDGDRSKNSYCEKPYTLVKDLLQRQQHQMNNMNNLLLGEKDELDIIKFQFNQATPKSLKDAANTSCLQSYFAFSKCVKRTSEYSVTEENPLCRVVSCNSRPNVPIRKCVRQSENDPFACPGCPVSTAYEAQCVHSLKANDGAFIMDQFALRHMRRDVVSGSYDKCVVEQIENDSLVEETPITDNNDTSTNFDSGTDILSSVEQNENDSLVDSGTDILSSEQEASYWESRDMTQSTVNNSSNTVKSLNRKLMRNLVEDILNNYEKCSEKTRLSLGAIFVSAKDISISDGESCGIFGASGEGLPLKIEQLVDCHKNSFLPRTGAFSQVVKPSASHLQRETKQRLKGALEIARRKKQRVIVNNKKTVTKCKFCQTSEKNHTENNCTKQSHLKSIATEYEFGESYTGYELFKSKVTLSDSFDLQSSVSSSSFITSIGRKRASQHLFVHRVWPKSILGENSYDLTGLNFEFSYINDSGVIEKEKFSADGTLFQQILSRKNLLKGKGYVYLKFFQKDNTFELHKAVGGASYLNRNYLHHNNMSFSQPIPTNHIQLQQHVHQFLHRQVYNPGFANDINFGSVVHPLQTQNSIDYTRGQQESSSQVEEPSSFFGYSMDYSGNHNGASL